MARCIASGISTSLISTMDTSTPPRVRLHLDDLTEVRVEFLPMGEEGVEIRPA
ncbi:Asp/Glu racemase [Cutibacterium avidum ATCC 25577]|uniref:Asp/Glu racemase n=1 Tax=Cutibacterium avidum ATCC 25577 TaxID=997355 RepID=G4CVN8_9ACTN|nr:Asp/Glu racemase [Cutibacterium avidum ATCC 25577]